MKVELGKFGLGLLISLLALSLASASDQEKSAGPDKPAAKAELETGKEIYKTHCAICHFATSTLDRVGPGMKGLFKLKKLPKSGLPVTEENVRNVIEKGAGDPRMATMPAYRDLLSRKELSDLVAYLKTL